MSDPIEELNRNTFKQNKLTFKKHLEVILPVYYQLILADGIVDESETAGFVQFLTELDFSQAEIVERQAQFKDFELVKNRPSHEKVLEQLSEAIKNEPYNLREYLFVHIILFGSIENINVSEQNYILKVIETLGIEEHKAEEVIEIIRNYIHNNKNIKYFL